MRPADCTVCGSRLPKKSRFCPECGARVGAETAVVDVMTAEPRFFARLVGHVPGTPVARVALFRQRRELVELFGLRTDAARALGETAYAGDKETTKTARARMKELDGLIAAKEGEMQQTAAGAMERIQHAQLQVQPTQVETPEPRTREPFPEP